MNVMYNYGQAKGVMVIRPSTLKPGKWTWEAAGNSGAADTQERAIQDCREWILQNFDKLSNTRRPQ